MHGFRIGRVSGIELRVDWSWVLIFVLLTWNLIAVFSHWHPFWSLLETFATAASASLVFFGCIVLHELAHSVVAKRYGLEVRSITLFLFGGVSNIEYEPPSAKSEFLIAIVGPITSIALGVVFLLLASAATTISMADAGGAWAAIARLGPMATLLVWLGPINIMIGLFNLVPGFPLDGGRILRSILWRVTGELSTATRWASATGQMIGWLFIGGGIAMTFGVRLPFFGTGLGSGIWLAFIGWFLHSAAVRASSRLALDETLAGITVEQLMRRDCPTVTPELSVADLVHEHLIPGDDRALPVVQDEVFVGLVSMSDVRGLPPGQWMTTPVRLVMRARDTLAVAAPDEPLVKAFERLALRDVEQLPVVLDGRLMGMLRRRDIARWLELAWKPRVKGTNGDAAMRAPTVGRAPGRDEGMHGHGGRDAHHVV